MRFEAGSDGSGWRGTSDDESPVWRGDESAVVAGLRRELAAARAAASPRSPDDEESRRRFTQEELEAARAALTDQRLRGDPAEDDAVARLREALGRKDDQLEVLEDEVSRCRGDVERRRGVEEELRRELLAKTSSTPPSGAKLLRTLAHGESPDLENDADGNVEALERDLEEAQETISSLEAAADEAADYRSSRDGGGAGRGCARGRPGKLEARKTRGGARADCSAARRRSRCPAKRPQRSAAALPSRMDKEAAAAEAVAPSALEDEIKARVRRPLRPPPLRGGATSPPVP